MPSKVLLTLAGCGNSGGAAKADDGAKIEQETPEVSQPEQAEETTTAEEEAVEEAETAKEAKANESAEPGTREVGKAVVVYFSGSGNTKRVAEYAADEIGAELFELVPVNPYTDADLDWTDRSSRVNAEHNDEALQDIELISTEVPDWSTFDTVLIGYPLW